MVEWCPKRYWPLLAGLAVLWIVKIVHANDDFTSTVKSEAAAADDDTEFELLKEIYKKNLLQDYLDSSVSTDGGNELDAIIGQRVNSFLRDRQEYTSRKAGRRNRRDVDDEADAAIEADTAAARHLYLKGFRERGYVPVNFPVDICLLRVGKQIFAAALHQSETSNRTINATTVSFYRRIKGKFEKYLEHQAVTARHFDCVSIAQLGFVAVVNYHDQELNVFEDGSPVFQIQEDGTTEIVQTFGQPNQHTVHLWVHGKNVYLAHTYTNLDANRQNVCPLYRWSGYYFDVVDHMPCYNAVRVVAFSIEQQLFVAVARQMAAGETRKDSFSDIFLLNPDTQKLVLHQQIYTYAVSDIAYFFIEERDRRLHFIITGNSLSAAGGATGNDERGGGGGGGGGALKSQDSVQNSIVYKFVDGFFVPFQNMELNGVKMFLPVVHENGEFLLLVLCHDQPLSIYEYDGWKLAPSRIDYTGEAFAAGVAHMRVYRHIVNASVIVIANSNLFGKSVNLFSPQYGVENDLRQVYAHFIEWCERMHEQTSLVDLEDLYNRLAALPDTSVDGARSIDKNIELQDSTVSVVKASAIKTKDVLVDEALLSYVVEVNEYVQRVSAKIDLAEQTIGSSVLTNGTVHWNGDLQVSELIASAGEMKQLDVKVLNNGAHKTRHTDGAADGPSDDDGFTLVDRLIVDRFVDVRFWNGHAAWSLLLTDDIPAKWQHLSVTAEKVVVGGNLHVNKLIDGIFFHPSNVLLPGVDQVFSVPSLVVKDLNVNRLMSKRLNSTDATAVHRMMEQSRTLLAKSRGAMPQAYGNDFDTIDVDDLQLTGLLNEIDTKYLTENVLLHEAESQQQLGGKLFVDQITADNVLMVEPKLSGIEWTNVARTTEAQQILQDLQFVQPITIEDLVLRDRLNHIPVIDGKLQVLLLQSNETQSITGTKTFDYVTLLKPIELQGKIDGEALTRMNPIVTTVADLILDGNYTILGNVTFNGPLAAHNILSASGTHGLHRLATHGLRLDSAPDPKQVIRFLQPVFVEHLSAPQINELDVNDLVPQATGEVQYLTGRKTFIGDLSIDGVADANEINKIDLNQLNRTIFRREESGIEQTIEGTIHFDTIITSVINAKRVLFEGKRMDRLLRLDIPQNVSAPVRFENCSIYVENSIVTQELHTEDERSLVFGYDLDHLFKDTLRLDADVGGTVPVVSGPKSFRNLTVGQLVLLDGSTMNSIPVENIKHILVARENRTILKHGAYPFQGEITVTHLHFEGSINGIPKESFCRAWLMRTGDQSFTVEQTFATVVTERLDFTGKLNGVVTMEQLLEDAYRTDREEYIDQIIFHEGIVSYDSSTVGGLVSGLNLSSDVLLKQSPEIQNLGTVQISQTLEAKGELHILNLLNGIHFPKMMEFFAPSDGVERTDPNIEVRGNVYFEHDPTIIHLNGHNIQKLYDEVWLPHRPTVLTGKYHFESAEFHSSLHTNGKPINELDWNEVDARCLSGKRPQNISAPLHFLGDVTIHGRAVFQTVSLKGKLKTTKTSGGIDVQEYDQNALRYNGNQEIIGKWIFHNLKLLGEFSIQTLNGHNVETDYLRGDVSVNNFTATKRFRELHVESIVCPPPCVIQEVDMDEWYKNGLRLQGNQTIEGTLRIVDGVITGNVEVLGTVNGVRFDANHLMLKSTPQNINGSLSLITKFPEENKIFPLVFESLHAGMINGKDVGKFLANAARKDANPLVINIPVSFVNPIEVEEAILDGDMLFGVNITNLIQSTSYQAGVNALASQVRSLNSVNEKLTENVFENGPVFSHFDKLRPMKVNAVRMLVFSLPLFPSSVETVAIHTAESSEPSAINFYLWNQKELTLTPAKNIAPIIGRDRAIVNMKRLNLASKQHMFLQFAERESNSFVQQIMDLHVDPTGVSKFVPLYIMNSTHARDVIWMKLVKLDCIVMYSKGMVGFELRCLREQNLIPILDVRQLEKTATPIQIVALDNHLVMLDNHDHIQIWRTTSNFYLKHHQTIVVSHPSYLSVARYENQLMLAINSEHSPNTAHHGSIEIWRKTLVSNSTFVQHQLILTKLPKQLQFSVLPSNELLLYTLTENWLHPLVVYRFEGVTGFREVMTSNTIRQKAKRLSILKFRQAQREIIAIVGPESTDFVNVVFV